MKEALRKYLAEIGVQEETIDLLRKSAEMASRMLATHCVTESMVYNLLDAGRASGRAFMEGGLEAAEPLKEWTRELALSIHSALGNCGCKMRLRQEETRRD